MRTADMVIRKKYLSPSILLQFGCRMRTWLCSGLVVASLMIGWASSASAQELSRSGFRAAHFDPVAAQHVGLLNLRRPAVLPHATPSAGFFAHYADEPLKHSDLPSAPNGGFYLEREFTVDAALAVGLFDHVQISLAAPAVSAQWGRLPNAKEGEAPFGDSRAAVDLLLVDPEWANGWGVSATGLLRLPSGSTAEFTSDGKVRAEPSIAVGKRWASGHEFVLNGGLTIGGPQTVPRFSYTDAGTIRVGAGGRVHIPGTPVDIVASLFGRGSTVDDVQTVANKRPNTARSAEALGGVRVDLPANLLAQAGGGAGLFEGLPGPDFRIFTSLHWAPIGWQSGETETN